MTTSRARKTRGQARLFGNRSTLTAKLAELGAEPLLTDTYTNCLEPLRSGAVVAVSTDNVILVSLAAQNEVSSRSWASPSPKSPTASD